MRLTCPHCGERDLREFSVRGAAVSRPEGEGWGAEWDTYLHLRDNPCGESAEFWQHGPCGTWMIVRRDTATHAVLSCEAVE